MTAVTESDIRELKQLIQGQTEKLNSIEKEVIEVKTKLNTLDPIIQKFPDLIEKIGELKNWKQAGLIIVTAMISSIFSGIIGGVIGWLIRSGNRI